MLRSILQARGRSQISSRSPQRDHTAFPQASRRSVHQATAFQLQLASESRISTEPRYPIWHSDTIPCLEKDAADECGRLLAFSTATAPETSASEVPDADGWITSPTITASSFSHHSETHRGFGNLVDIQLRLTKKLQLTPARRQASDIDQSNNSGAVWKLNVVGRKFYTDGKHSKADWHSRGEKQLYCTHTHTHLQEHP